MSGKGSRLRAALDAQASAITQTFEGAGFELIEPEIVQPADVFLDRSGEELRSRTYVFSDPAGAELCLRPDLTIPACRFYLENQAAPGSEARYCYRGPAFRFQPGGGDGLHPREFDQAGVEHFGDSDPERADADIIALTIDALKRAGLREFEVKVGDLRLFTALLDSIDMPERWRQRLKHHFWRPTAFRDTLAELTGQADPLSPLAEGLNADKFDGATEAATMAVEQALGAQAIPLIGERSTADIAYRLREKAADRKTPPLAREKARLIENYIKVASAPRDALHTIMNLIVQAGMTMSTPLAAFARRITLMQERGIEVNACRFEADFGRTLEYYTGFVFQIDCPTPSGPIPIAGGGRYDGLLADIGSPGQVSAVGCAIHTERLLAATRRVGS